MLISYATPCPDPHNPFQPHFSFSNQPLPQSVIAVSARNAVSSQEAVTVAKRRWQSEFYREKQMPLNTPKFVKPEGSEMGHSLSLLPRQEQLAHGIATATVAAGLKLNLKYQLNLCGICVFAKRLNKAPENGHLYTCPSGKLTMGGLMAADTDTEPSVIRQNNA